MPHILFICTANICRSPVAEGLLRRRLEDEGLADWTVSSAGTWAQLRRGAASTSVELLAGRDIDISDHRAREVTGRQ
jgi:protein-tyrosine phosphatase